MLTVSVNGSSLGVPTDECGFSLPGGQPHCVYMCHNHSLSVRAASEIRRATPIFSLAMHSLTHNFYIILFMLKVLQICINFVIIVYDANKYLVA